MKFISHSVLFLSMASSLLFALKANAAGFYASDFGARGIGRSGADIVHTKDGYAIWNNPASLSLQKGISITSDLIGVQLNLHYERTGPFSLSESSGNYGGYRVSNHPHADIDPTELGLDSGDDWQSVFTSGKYPSASSVDNQASPWVLGCSDDGTGGLDGRGHCPISDAIAVFGERALGVKGLALSVGVFGPPTGGYWFWDESSATDSSLPDDKAYINAQGFDTRFTGPQRYTLIDREVLEMFYQFTMAYQISKKFAVGVGMQSVSSGLRMRTAVSADTFGSEDLNKDIVLNIQASSSGLPNANIGVWAEPWKNLEFGLSYQLPRPVTVKGPVHVDYMGPGLDGFVADDAKALATIRFNMPAITRLGLLYNFEPWFDVEAAMIFEQWSSWQANTVTIDNLNVGLAGMDPIALPTVVQPKAYQDTWSLRLGSDFDPLATILPGLLTLRAGALYESSAIPKETLDVSLIDADKFGLSAGVELAYMGVHLRAAYQHRFLADVVVDNTLASSIAPLGQIFGYETRTAVANGSYQASFDVGAIALTLDAVEMYDAIFADSDVDANNSDNDA